MNTLTEEQYLSLMKEIIENPQPSYKSLVAYSGKGFLKGLIISMFGPQYTWRQVRWMFTSGMVKGTAKGGYIITT